jgi:hypothetical protein
MSSVRALVAGLLLAAAAAGQGAVIVVDAAGLGAYTSIQPAVDAAADGDTILVKAGTYPGFNVIAKRLTIVGELNRQVQVNGTIAVAYLAASQAVVLRGFAVNVSFVVGALTQPPTFLNDAGPIWVEDCVIVDNNLGPSFSGFQGHGVAIASCASVVFARCSITGSTGSLAGHGIHAVASNVSLHDCTVRGADVQVSVQPIAGGNGYDQTDGFLHATGTTFIGGKGSNGVVITAQGLPPICHNGGAGGHGIVLSGASPAAALEQCVLSPGAGGSAQTAFGCSNGANGQPSVVNAGALTSSAGPARHYLASSPVRGAQSSSLQFQGPAGEAVWVAYASAGGHAFFPPLVAPLLLAWPPALLPAGTLPPSGALAVAVTAPDPAPGFVGFTVFSQAVFVSGSALALGPASAISVVSSAVP